MKPGIYYNPMTLEMVETRPGIFEEYILISYNNGFLHVLTEQFNHWFSQYKFLGEV